MKIATIIAQTIVRALVPIQLGLGVLFWTSNAFNLIPVHMLIGLLIVLALWILAGLAMRAGVHLGLVSGAFAWGILVVVLGMTQTQLVPGDLHWIIQVVHLLFGLAAFGFAEALGRQIRAKLVSARPRASYAATS
jgi:Dicarboxylate carrier protein MatC N-terminus